MKKLSMILSAVLAAAMAVPSVANAKNVYPSLSDYGYNGLLFQEELFARYMNGEYDFDFDLDGEITALDAHCLVVRYIETSTGNTLRNEFWDTSSSNQDDWKRYDFTDEMRARCIEDGDINGDGVVTAADASFLLAVIYAAEQQGDVNTDGFVDARDASNILAYYSAMSTGKTADYVTTKNMEYLGDFNGDGKIDAEDASAVLAEYSANSVSD